MVAYMEFYLLHIFVLFYFVVKGSNASQSQLPAELYWQLMLPNTPMPKALHNLIQPGNKSTFSEVEIDGRLMASAKDDYGVGYIPYIGAERRNKSTLSDVEIDVGQMEALNSRIDYGAGYIGRAKSTLPNSTTVYFLNDDLHLGKKMMLVFTKLSNGSNLLPRNISETVPFSSNKFSEILKYFSIKPTSKQSQIMKKTIQQCEAPGVKGEEKYCATSLESLVDFVVAKYGKNVQALSNEAEEEYKIQNYTILKDIKMMGDNQIVCHKKRYPYAVFYCHIIMHTKAYLVPLVGDDGSKAKAVVVCHTNTSSWNPEHVAFQVLRVKPGGPPICHFLNSDTVVWVPN